MIVGEAFGENEDKIKKPFVGASGIELLRMLDEAQVLSLTAEDRSFVSKFYDFGDPNLIDAIWSMHPEVYRTNVFNLHPPSNKIEAFCGGKAEALRGYPALVKGKYVRAEFEPELTRLGDEILEVDPNLIICLGNTPLWALSGQTGISKVRGTTLLSTHTVSGYKLLAAYHPAAVLRQWEHRPVTVADLMKAPREAAYPEIRRPPCEIWIEPTLADLEEFYERHIRGCKILSTDIETAGDQITCIGFAPKPSLAIVIPIYDSRRKERSYWPDKQSEGRAWAFIKMVLEERGVAKVFQNGLYDIAFLWRAYGIPCRGARHDTMLLSHALQPESLKGLGFLGSVYSEHGAWKNEHKVGKTIKRDA